MRETTRSQGLVSFFKTKSNQNWLSLFLMMFGPCLKGNPGEWTFPEQLFFGQDPWFPVLFCGLSPFSLM